MPRHKNCRIHLIYRPPSHKRRVLWWVGSAAVLLVGLLVIWGINLQSQAKGAPRLAVEQDTFNYGDVKLGITVETVFRVRNVGDKPLLILNQPRLQVIEGCCPPDAILSSSVIQPGQEATITLNFMMHDGMGGKHRFDIDLQTNDPTHPHKQLIVLSNWV